MALPNSRSDREHNKFVETTGGEVAIRVVGFDSGTSAANIEGNAAHDAVDSGNPVKVGGYAASSQRTAVSAADRVDAVYNLNGEAVIAGYDWTANALRVSEVDPISQHFVSETLAALTNIATNTTGYLYTDWDGYTIGTFQGETSGTTPTDVLTCTLEMTCQSDGTAPASCTYQDVTTALTGAASYVDTNFMWIINTPIAAKYLRTKYNTSNGGGNDADLTVYHKRLYS
jgi:hypothetical protein